MTILSKFLTDRQKKLAATLKSAGLDGIILNPSESLVYLTGLHFHLSERPVVCLFTPNDPPRLILPELEAAKVTAAAYPIQATTYGEEPETWQQQFTTGLSVEGLNTVGVEDEAMRLLEYRLLTTALPETRFIDAAETIGSLRMYKDESETDAMQRAAEIAESALSATLPQIKIGMTELEVAGILVQELLRAGSEGKLPFQPIVSTGPNSANPHAFPSSRQLQKGDMLVIDFGASHQSYFSDITRTFAIGKFSAEQEEVYNTVLAANQAGHNTAKPGVTCSRVDEAARGEIEGAGYGQYFIHRTGHGLGMQGHEPPYIRGGNPMVLEPGMTFTIEPGIYLPDQFGVRIEDDVIVTEDGLHSFTTFPRELQTIGG